MISPKQTVFAMARPTVRRRGPPHGVDECRARVAVIVETAAPPPRLASTSAVPTPIATAPARIQSPAFSRVTPPVGISRTLRQRPAQVLEEAGPERRRREHLDDVGAGLPRGEDLGRREAAGHHRHVVLVTRLDDAPAGTPG